MCMSKLVGVDELSVDAVILPKCLPQNEGTRCVGREWCGVVLDIET
jgi:hypothetical protein